MKQRNPFAVFFLSLITLGIYSIYWEVKTKGEMVQRGAAIPTAWLIIIPFVSIWWLWKYSEGVEKVTVGKLQGIIAFILIFLLGSIGQAIIQDSFNKIGTAAADPIAPVATTPSEQSQAPVITPTTSPQEPTPPVTPVEPTESTSPTTPPVDPTNPA